MELWQFCSWQNYQRDDIQKYLYWMTVPTLTKKKKDTHTKIIILEIFFYLLFVVLNIKASKVKADI